MEKIKTDTYNRLVKYLRETMDDCLKGKDYYAGDIADDVLMKLGLEKDETREVTE